MDNRGMYLQWAWATLRAFRHAHVLTEAAWSQLAALMRAGCDFYPYTSVDGQPNVWCSGVRVSAEQFNAMVDGVAPEAERVPLEEQATLILRVADRMGSER